MTPANTERDPLEALAADFVQRHRRGEQPTLEEYVERQPELADAIRELFPTILAMEDLKRDRAAPPAAGSAPQRLERLGDYRIVREIGRGGMGIVYEAEQESLGRRVAVKVLPRQTLLDEKKLRRFEREARTAARLHHTNIVPVFGVGEQDGLHYYVMQLIRGVGLDAVTEALASGGTPVLGRNGDVQAVVRDDELATTETFSPRRAARALCSESFAHALKAAAADSGSGTTRTPLNGSPLPEVEPTMIAPGLGAGAPLNQEANEPAVADRNGRAASRRRFPKSYWHNVAVLGLQVADALAYAHAQNVLHRDIKPANLLLDATGNVWVADFGLAKALEYDEVSQAGDVVGTPQYMAPEQFHGKYDARSDLCSLGLTLFELLTLRSAYQDTNRFALFRKITQEEPPRPRKFNPSIPRDLETIVLKAIARDPERRYQTARELQEDLQRFVDDRQIRARRAGPVERLARWCRRNKAVAALLALVFSLLVVVAVVATAAYVQTRDALEGETEQRRIAESSQEREAQQRQRAETTSGLAVDVLDQIFEQLAPERITAASELTFETSGGEQVEVSLQPTLSPETAALLEKLLVFYDRLAKQGDNDSKLRHKAARANRRVGDIRLRLAQPVPALEAYEHAAAIYKELTAQAPDNLDLTAELAGVHNAIGQARLKNFDLPGAQQSHLAAVDVLTTGPAAATPSPRIKYELARTYYNLGRSWFDRPGPPKTKPAGGPANGKNPDAPLPGRPGAGPPGPPPWQSGKSETEKYFAKAVDLLRGLVSEHPAVPAYRHLLALCFREKSMRSTFGFNKGGNKDRREAIKLLEQLVKDFPNVPDYRFDLSETLARMGSPFFVPQFGGKNLEKDYQEALRLSKDLVAEHPNVPDYQVSKSHIHMSLAELHRRNRELDKAEQDWKQALKMHNALVKRFPTVAFHRIMRARIQDSLAGIYIEQKKWADSRPLLDAAIDELAQLARTDDKMFFVKFMLADSYGKLAATLRGLGEPELAKQADEQARKNRPGPFKGPPGRGKD